MDPVGRAMNESQKSIVKRQGERGFALLLVLGVCLFLAIGATTLSSEAGSSARLAFAAAGAIRAEALAESGVNRAIAGLFDPDASSRWLSDGTPRRLSFDGGEITVRINDEAGKIDLNAAPTDLIAGLIEAVGWPADTAQTVAAAVGDYRDEDDVTGNGGEESEPYRRLGLAHGPRNGPFQLVEELSLVAGVDSSLLAAVRPYVTVYTNAPGVDPAKADRTVLRALPGLTPSDTDRIALAQRRGPEAARTVASTLASAAYLSRSSGRVFAIRSEATAENGGWAGREAVIRIARRAGRPFLIHFWKPLQRPDNG
jgi:general secretion pathway protein K